jgi:hypothetical protein
MIAGVSTAVALAAQDVSLEYRVKAAYLYNFVKYVDWPDRQGGTILICIAGQNPFGTVLEGLIRNERIHGLSLATKTIPGFEPDCNVIFTPSTSNIPVYLRESAGMPILTVGETPRFIEQGGIINFFVDKGGAVRFEINRTAADRAKLRISSRLLQFAKITEAGTDER